MKSYRLTPLARQDLLGIWDYVAADNVDAADRTVAALFRAFELVARFPNLGRTREEWTVHAARFFVVLNYHVVYRADVVPLTVIAVIHGARDVPSVLRQQGR